MNKCRQLLPSAIAFVVAIVLSSLLNPSAGATVWEARTLLGQARDALRSAQQQTDPQAAQELMTNALDLLRQARRLFEEARAGQSNEIETLMDYSETLRLAGDHDLAAEVLDRAVKLAPDNAAAWLALGRNLSELGPRRAPQAQKALRKGIELEKDSPVAAEAYFVLGSLYHEEGLYDLARESFDRACAIHPEHVPSLVALAAFEVRAGNLLEASQKLDALGLQGQLPPPLQAMLAGALEAFQRSRKGFPDTADHHAAYAKILIRLNQAPVSRLPLERAVKLDPDNFVYWNLLASVCRFVGDTDRAREAYLHSLEVNPDQPRVQELLQSLSQETQP